MTQRLVGPRRFRLLLFVMTLGLIDVVDVNAQGGITSSLSGTVVDSSGSMIPGADVVVKNIGTGETLHAVTSENGTFNIPAINPGTYEATISLTGFKRAVLTNIKVNAATPATIRASLDVGELAEVVQVSAGAEIVQTQSSALSTTVNVKQISEIPLTSRNVLDFVPMLPGFNTPGGNRDTTVFGLPQSAINITYDGVNVQDNTLKTTDGFFTAIQPRLDAVEEATITTGAQGADSSGGGTVQIRFVTRSGTNELRGSAYHYYRNDKLNANTWFNERDGLPTPALKQNQPGFRVGGPIVIPGLWDGHNKGFFFVNYEEFRQPQDVTRNRTILHPRGEAGFFRYNTAGGAVSEIDLLALAARNGQTSTMDPTIAALLADIRASVATTGAVTDLAEPLTQRFSYNVLQNAKNRYPTFRVDFNLTQNHRLSASGNYHTFSSTPDTLNNREPFFPGFPATGTQTSSRRSFSSALRSTFGQSLVNEFRVGYSGAPIFFYKELGASMWGGSDVADQGGFFLDIGGSQNTATTGLGVAGLGITNASNQPTPSSRDATTMLVENTMNWLKGKHSLSLGGSFTQANIRLINQTIVPEVDFGIVPGDPANAMFTVANFPNASAADLTRAQNQYALLTGRVATIAGNARINEDSGEYAYLGAATQRARMRDFGFYIQDQWRVRQNLTINAGLRYELQLPFTALNDSYATATMADVCGVSGVGGSYGCNLFQPGTQPGAKPTFINLSKGVRVYDIDWNNWAPSVGGNWTPTAETGMMRRLLGKEGDTSISAGFSMAYNRNGMSDFTGIFGANPGVLIDVNRNQSLNNLGSVPLLFRDRARLDPPAFASAPVYPMTDVETGDVNIFDSKLQVPWSQSWQIGIQRSIGAQMAIEARYVGTRSGDLWAPAFNFNEINVTENGFLNEFRLAQQNLQANIAAGRGATFRYAGPGTGTAPLPIFLAYFSGLPSSAAGDTANYSSALFTNNTFINPLATRNPQPYVAANALDADAARRTNALRAGLPANFIVANPDLLGGANVTTNGGGTRYNAMVLVLKRRMNNGLFFDTSYTYGKGTEQNRFSFRQPWQDRRDSGGEGEIVHAWKMNWVYELPFGRDRRFASNAGPVLDRLIGRWSVTGAARIQSGRLIDIGNVRLVGMTKKELGDMFQLRIDENRRVWMLPQDVIDNTVKAFSVSATSATGYGSLGAPTGKYLAPANGPDCVEVDHDGDGTSNQANQGITDEFGVCGEGSLIVTGPMFKNVDLSVLKQVPIKGRTNLELRFEILNLFNKANFIPVGIGNLGSNANSYEVTELTGTQTSRVMQLVARFNF